MARLFSTFPGGWPGLGLLLLRATVGIAAGVEGGACFLNSENGIFGAWLVGGLAVAAGNSAAAASTVNLGHIDMTRPNRDN